MFWALIMEPNKWYSQTVKKAFHVSMATLDVSTADDDFVQVMLRTDNRNYLLCNLKKSTHCQKSLDLNFQEGAKITFALSGRGNVHLTGYLIPDELADLEEEAEDEEEEEEEEEDVNPMMKNEKRKAKKSPIDTKAAKKLKPSKNTEDEDEDDSDDDEDEEGEENINETIEMEDDDSEEEEEEEEESDDDDDDDEDDDDEEDEDEEEKVQTQQKKNKQNKQPQNQNQNQKSQKQPNAMVNGKDTKLKKKEEEKSQNDQEQKKKTLTGGVQIEDIRTGSGMVAKSGKFVSVYYVGRLKNGKKFDATTSGDGFKFRLGKGEVIKGWDVGVQGMKVGGKRRITIPPALAYGAKGSPPVIPGNSTLVFEVELKNVH